MSALKQAIDFYKEQKFLEKSKKQLLNSKSDFAFLEKLIQKCNSNPNLKIEIHLTDGTRILMRSFEAEKKYDFEKINGDYLEVS